MNVLVLNNSEQWSLNNVFSLQTLRYSWSMSVCFPFFCLIIFAHWLWWNLFGAVTASSDNPSTYLLVKFGASAISGQLLVPQRFFAFFIPLSCRYWGESFNNSFKWDFDQSQHQQSFNNSFGNDASKDDEYSSAVVIANAIKRTNKMLNGEAMKGWKICLEEKVHSLHWEYHDQWLFWKVHWIGGCTTSAGCCC